MKCRFKTDDCSAKLLLLCLLSLLSHVVVGLLLRAPPPTTSEMFRKKKEFGSVTVLDDDEESGQDFNDLGLDEKRPSDGQDDLQNMTTEQLEKLAISTAQAGKESTTRALRTAMEAREIATTTAQTMQQQTEQLENMSEQIEVVHDYLDKSERTIEKLNKPKLVRMFQRKKPAGKGLDKVKVSRKENEQREELRTKGLDSIDVKKLQTSVDGKSVQMQDLQREQLLEEDAGSSTTTGRLAWLGKKSREPAPRVQTRDIQDDYSQYSSGVADVLRQQDDDLDAIGDAIADMKAMGTAMNNELDYQNTLVTDVQERSSVTAQRTKANARKIARIK